MKRSTIFVYAVTLALGVALGIALLLMSGPGWRIGLMVLGIVAIYVLIWVPRPMRELAFRSTVTARCVPNDVFSMVSDPNNWHRYWPELDLVEAPRLPLRVGDIIRDRVTTAKSVQEAAERVIEYEPGRRFGTAIVGGRRGTGVYELSEVDGGTQITYIATTALSVVEAAAGYGFVRGHLAAQLKANRDRGMGRLKQLLEAEPEPTV